MTKTFSAAMIIAFATLSPLSAVQAMEPMKCNKAAMHEVEMMIKEHKGDKAMATKAMHENEMAMKAKKAGDKKGCAMHLNMAAGELMKH